MLIFYNHYDILLTCDSEIPLQVTLLQGDISELDKAPFTNHIFEKATYYHLVEVEIISADF